MTAIARAVRLEYTVKDLGYAKRIVLRCPCAAVAAMAVRDVSVEEVLDELRRRHRALRPPTCAHREALEGALVNEM